MDGIRITGKVLRWGNSYGIRLRKQDLERAGINEGENVQVQLGTHGERRIDLSDLPFFHDPDPRVSTEHDKHVGEARSRSLHGQRRERRK